MIEDCLKENVMKHESEVNLEALQEFRAVHDAHIINIDNCVICVTCFLRFSICLTARFDNIINAVIHKRSLDPIFRPAYSFE